MPYVIGFLILFLLIGVIVISIGVGIGFVLSNLIPGLGIGMGIVAGAIFSIGTMDFWVRLISLSNDVKGMIDEDEDEDLEYEEDPYIIVPQKLWKASGTHKRGKKTKKR